MQQYVLITSVWRLHQLVAVASHHASRIVTNQKSECYFPHLVNRCILQTNWPFVKSEVFSGSSFVYGALDWDRLLLPARTVWHGGGRTCTVIGRSRGRYRGLDRYSMSLNVDDMIGHLTESSWRNNCGKSPGSVAKFAEPKFNVTELHFILDRSVSENCF
jgi:hypothetical protein